MVATNEKFRKTSQCLNPGREVGKAMISICHWQRKGSFYFNIIFGLKITITKYQSRFFAFKSLNAPLNGTI